MALKKEITQLSKEIDEQQISQLKLKMVRECIAEYNTMVTHCKVTVENNDIVLCSNTSLSSSCITYNNVTYTV